MTTQPTTPALYFIVARYDDGYSRGENVRVILTDTQAQAEAEAQAMTSHYTYSATLYAVTDAGYRGDVLSTHRHER